MREELRVMSVDGTALSVHVAGTGPPVVLVHGTTGSRASWALVEPLLTDRLTVWSYDRRGRGASGDDPEHDLACEVDDLRTVVDAVGEPTHVVGHSFGACVAMEAVAGRDDIRSLALYEPPWHAARCEEPLERALALLRVGDREGALEVFLPEVAGCSPEEVAMIRSIPDIWQRLLEATPPAAREADALTARGWEPARYHSITAPTLHLRGELTPRLVYLSHDELREAIPHATEAVLTGQRHLAFAFDPAPFARAVLGHALGLVRPPTSSR